MHNATNISVAGSSTRCINCDVVFRFIRSMKSLSPVSSQNLFAPSFARNMGHLARHSRGYPPFLKVGEIYPFWTIFLFLSPMVT